MDFYGAQHYLNYEIFSLFYYFSRHSRLETKFSCFWFVFWGNHQKIGGLMENTTIKSTQTFDAQQLKTLKIQVSEVSIKIYLPSAISSFKIWVVVGNFVLNFFHSTESNWAATSIWREEANWMATKCLGEYGKRK